jgi:hypothetical protein
MFEQPRQHNNPQEPHIEHAAGFVLSPERQVDCTCDVRLQRSVLRDPTGWNERITACMSCGKVSHIESIVDEPRPHDVRCVGNRIKAVAPDVLTWISAWPRLAWGVWQQDRGIYLPATLRCHSAEDLALNEQDYLIRQRNLPAAQRLLDMGIPDKAPPAILPPSLKSFAQTQIGVRLGPDTDLQTLLSHANRGDWAFPFAYEQLKLRLDFKRVIVNLLASNDIAERDRGILIVQYGRLNEPEIVKVVIGLLEQASLDQEGQAWLAMLLDTLYYIGPAAADARPMLLEIARKIGDRNYYLRKRVEQVRELIK